VADGPDHADRGRCDDHDNRGTQCQQERAGVVGVIVDVPGITLPVSAGIAVNPLRIVANNISPNAHLVLVIALAFLWLVESKH